MKKSPKLSIPFFNPLNIHSVAKRFTKKKPRFTWKKFARWSLYGFLIFLFGIALLFAWFSKDLPTPGNIQHRYVIQSSQIYARDGKTPLYSISGDIQRTVITKDQMPLTVRQATVAIEDKNFYHNFGIDFRGIARAIIYDLTKKDYGQGGSTITQQFVKNALLSPQKSITRKIKEVILSMEIELMYNKEDILTMYLNEIPYGKNAYGIESASQMYFNKHAKDLTLGEAATLAALPQSPTYYYNHKDDLLYRRNLVLKEMVKQGYLKQDAAQVAMEEPIKFVPPKEDIQAPHFVMYVKEVLTEKYGEQMVEQGGLHVTTTLDMDKQKIAETAVTNYASHLKQYGASNTGLVSVDPQTGQILAMVGSLDYFDTANDGNYNVTTASRQPGSSIKPLVYATGFEGKYNPASILFDLRTDFGGGYTPVNYNGTYSGPVTVRYALGNSLNIPAVRMLALVGTDKALDTMHSMGITTLQDKDKYGLSLVLGGGEVRPLDMATAYGVFADGGLLQPTTPILKVTDSSGKVLEEWKSGQDQKQVLKPEVAYEINNILSDFNAKKPTFSFATGDLTLPDRPVAVKTGTTDSYRDAWTIGYTPSLVTAVWAGNNDNHPMTPSGGAIGAAPLWHTFMQKALSGTKSETFSRPSTIQDISVDKMSNKLPSQYSPQIIKDIFAPWQAPTEKDDIHVSLAVCKDNGLLAPKDAPADLVVQKVFTNIHSEFPNLSNWENPVIAWAKANGMYNPAPAQSCNISEIKPSVSITSPADNAQVSGTITISAQATSSSGIQNVEFFVDDISIGSVSSAPYSITYNVNQLSNGSHSLSVTATSTDGSTNRATITIKVGNDTTPPGNISAASGSSPSNGKVILTWTNPSDSDLSLVKIYLSHNGTVGSFFRSFPANPGSSQQVTFTGLDSGPTYFTIRPVDNSGNELAVGSPQVSITVK